MKNKVLVFVYNKKTKKFLLFFNKPSFNQNGFTFNKEVNEKEDISKSIKSDFEQRFGLVIEEVFSLNWGSVYMQKGEEIKEMNYLIFVNSDKVSLTRENISYEWLNIEDFIKKIHWNDKKVLEKVLTKAINKEIYFNKKEREERI